MRFLRCDNKDWHQDRNPGSRISLQIVTSVWQAPGDDRRRKIPFAIQLARPVLQLNRIIMSARRRILPALLLACSPLAGAQFSNPVPHPPPPPPPRPVLIPAPPLSAAGTPWVDPCEAQAATVSFDTCYAAQFKQVDQDLNHLYRAALLAFEQDIADAHRRSDSSQLAYDSTALFDLKAAQEEWSKYRDLQCRAAGQQFQGGSIQPIVVNRCLILLTRERMDDIRTAYEIGGRKLQ